MRTDAMRQKLHDYIRVAEDKKIKAIYRMVRDDVNFEFDILDDKQFLTELGKRAAEYDQPAQKRDPWEGIKR